MKKLSSISNKNNTKVSLKDFSIEIQERLQNIDNKVVECCCCDGDLKCCEPTCGCSAEPQMTFFYSESEIVNILKTSVKVQTLYNLHNQFGNRFRFKSENPSDTKVPLYFKEIIYPNNDLLAELQANMLNAQYNTKIFSFINQLCNDYNLGYPVVLSKANNKAQLFFIFGTGTNGSENSIKNSLLQVYELLNELQGIDYINWATVLDVSIDTCDDVYTFVITCTINMDEFPVEDPIAQTIKKSDNIVRKIK